MNTLLKPGKFILRQNGPASKELPVALFDASHGQPNWAQTGFTSRELHTNFAGLTEILCRLGFQCRTTHGERLSDLLPQSRLLVLPPPTGRYDSQREQWRCELSSFFTTREVQDVFQFLENGGSLLAFAYRFGDLFTQTNLSDLFTPLGCRLNNDAVIDASAVRQMHPLEIYFDTPADSLPLGWSRTGVATVRWRPSATFTVLSNATVWPLALSPGGCCLSFNRGVRRISFESLPLAVAGRLGRGRFALFGGPHLFETGPLGLLAHGDNTKFLHNVIGWLLSENDNVEITPNSSATTVANQVQPGLTRVENYGNGERTIASVERVLRKTGVLKALSRAKWQP